MNRLATNPGKKCGLGAQRYIQHVYDGVSELLFVIDPKPVGVCAGLQREMVTASKGLVAQYDKTLAALAQVAAHEDATAQPRQAPAVAKSR